MVEFPYASLIFWADHMSRFVHGKAEAQTPPLCASTAWWDLAVLLFGHSWTYTNRNFEMCVFLLFRHPSFASHWPSILLNSPRDCTTKTCIDTWTLSCKMTNATDAKMRTGSLPALPPKIHLDEDIEMKDDTERNSAQIHDDDTDASNEGLQSEESSFKDGTDCDTHDVSQLSTDPCSIEIASAQGSFSEKAKDASTNQRIHPVRRDSRSRHDETNSVDRGWESTSYRSKDPEPVAAGATRTPNWARKLTKNISLAPEIAQLHNQLSEATNKLQLEREYNRDLGKKHSHYANELKAERAYRQRLLDDHARLVQKLERDFDQRVRQLESQVRHEQDQSQVLNKGYGKIEKELKRAQDCARQLEDDHNRALQKLEKNFSERHRDLVDERDDATKALRKLQIQYDVSEEEHKKSQQRLEAESRAAERKSQDLVMKLRTLQEHAARNVESAQWMPQSVTETERQLNSILGAIKQWSEKRMRISKSGTSSCTNPAELDKDILQGLDMISVQEQDCPPVPLSTKLVLSAAVSTYAFRNIIGDVFFAFRNSMKTEQCADVYVGSNGEALTNIFEDIAKGEFRFDVSSTRPQLY